MCLRDNFLPCIYYVAKCGKVNYMSYNVERVRIKAVNVSREFAELLLRFGRKERFWFAVAAAAIAKKMKYCLSRKHEI